MTTRRTKREDDQPKENVEEPIKEALETKDSLVSLEDDPEPTIEERVTDIETVLNELLTAATSEETTLETQEIKPLHDYNFNQLLGSFLTIRSTDLQIRANTKSNTDDIQEWCIDQTLRLQKKLKQIEKPK